MSTAIITVTPTIELPESIERAYASREEITGFLHRCINSGVKLTTEQKLQVRYAQVRDAYRKGENIRLRDFALMSGRTVARIQDIVRKVWQEDRGQGDWLTIGQCDKILSSIMEM